MNTDQSACRTLTRLEFKIRSIDDFMKEWQSDVVSRNESAAILCSTKLREEQIPEGLCHLHLPFDDTWGNLSIRRITALCDRDRRRYPDLTEIIAELQKHSASEIIFTVAQAREIATFTEALDASVTCLYCCCDYGQSRSSAVAAALMYAAGAKNQEEEFIWNNRDPDFLENPKKQWYTPNPLVYMMLRETLGCPASGNELYALRETNMETAFLRIDDAVRRIAEKEVS